MKDLKPIGPVNGEEVDNSFDIIVIEFFIAILAVILFVVVVAI